MAAADVRYTGAHVSIFYHSTDVLAFDQNEMTDMVAGKYLPPVRLDGAEGNAILAMVSENGNSQIIVTASSISLNVTFSPQWQQQPELGREYVLERLPLLFGVISGLRDSSLIYAGAVVDVQIVSDLTDPNIARVIEDIYGGRFGTDLTDLAVKASEVVGEIHYRNVTVQNFRDFVPAPPTPPQIRLKNATASRRGVGVSVDYNSRYGYNEGVNRAVTLDDVSGMIAAAYSASADMTRRVAERMT